MTDSTMFSDVKNPEIFKSIIMSITVYVIYMLFGSKFSAKIFFHHMAMLKHSFAIYCYAYIAFFRNRTALCFSITALRTKLFVSSGRGNGKNCFACFTTALLPRVIVCRLSNYSCEALRFSFMCGAFILARSRTVESDCGAVRPYIKNIFACFTNQGDHCYAS